VLVDSIARKHGQVAYVDQNFKLVDWRDVEAALATAD